MINGVKLSRAVALLSLTPLVNKGRIDENTFFNKLMRCKRSWRRLRGAEKGQRCISATNVKFEEPVLTISYSLAELFLRSDTPVLTTPSPNNTSVDTGSGTD